MIKKYFWALPFLCSFLIGCGDNYVFEETHALENSAWTYDNQLAYEFEVSDTNKIYNLLLEVQHTTDYAYQNCYFKINTQFPTGEKTDYLLSVDLADGIGRWQGDCSGESCTTLFDIAKQTSFKDIGKHTITLEQYMRVNPLKGLESLAIKLEDTRLER